MRLGCLRTESLRRGSRGPSGGGHSDVAEQGAALLQIDGLDYERLIERARSEGLDNALVELERIMQRARRGESIPSHELHEIAKRLQRKP